jgi:hypothetical protein
VAVSNPTAPERRTCGSTTAASTSIKAVFLFYFFILYHFSFTPHLWRHSGRVNELRQQVKNEIKK